MMRKKEIKELQRDSVTRGREREETDGGRK